MLDAHREIQALVDNFVADLSELAKRIAVDQIRSAFGADARSGSPAARRPAPSEPSALSEPSEPSDEPNRGNRARRGQREIEALRGKVLAAIAERPGRRAEDINSALGTTTPQIAQLLRRLVADQLVRTEGARRGTRYFVTGPADVQSGRRAPEAAASASEPPS